MSAAESFSLNFLFLLGFISLLGKDDCGTLTEEESLLLRLLTPVYKAYYAKSMVGVCAELIEAFGGQGYIEDTGIPCLMRDAQACLVTSWKFKLMPFL